MRRTLGIAAAVARGWWGLCCRWRTPPPLLEPCNAMSVSRCRNGVMQICNVLAPYAGPTSPLPPPPICGLTSHCCRSRPVQLMLHLHTSRCPPPHNHQNDDSHLSRWYCSRQSCHGILPCLPRLAVTGQRVAPRVVAHRCVCTNGMSAVAHDHEGGHVDARALLMNTTRRTCCLPRPAALTLVAAR